MVVQRWIRLAGLFAVLCVVGSNVATVDAGAVISGLTDIGDPHPEPWEIGDAAFGEDVLMFVDRVHQYNSDTGGGNPLFSTLPFNGADYVRTTNDSKSEAETTVLYQITFAQNADVYLFQDNRKNGGAPLGWMSAMGFVDSGLGSVGVDESADGDIDQTSNILVASLAAGTYDFMGIDHSGNNYGLAAVGVIPEPSTFVLAIIGLLGFAILRRRRGK